MRDFSYGHYSTSSRLPAASFNDFLPTTARTTTTDKSPAGIERDHLVFFSLDHEACVGDVAAAILSLQKNVEAAGASVGAGVLSMMGFETSKALLQVHGLFWIQVSEDGR